MVNNKSHKPSREDLLHELESIRKSLLEDSLELVDEANETGEVGDHTSPKTSSNKKHTENVSQTSSPKAEQKADAIDESDYLLDIPEPETPESEAEIVTTAQQQKSIQSENMTVLPGQQSLFEDATTSDTPTSTHETIQVLKKDIEKAEAHTEQKVENPFLPKHVKDKLERERTLYQKEIDEATKVSGLTQNMDKLIDDKTLVDELVALYLPKIEQDLRERLKQRLNLRSEDD